jgi:thioredoxin-dependent peroxiredoxin
MTEWVEVGATAPKFTLTATDGTKIRLADLKGTPVVLYFYPKDDTPGCTKEACAFRDRKSDLEGLGARVFGVSPDDVDSHQAFSEKFSLNFPLLADANHAVAEKYGAWRERNRYGKKFMGIQRSTFIIDVHGKVARMWIAVQVDGHDDKVLEALQKLVNESSKS